MRLRWCCALICWTLGCGPGRGSRVPVDLNVSHVRSSVAQLRGLPERTPTPVEVVDDETFVRMLSERGGDADAGEGRGSSSVDAAAAQERDVELEDTLGFYDIPSRAIFIRTPSEGSRERLPLSWILVHELTHALQHQNFSIRDIGKMPTVDEQLAYLALLEGDAMITMLAHGAQERFVPIPRAILIAMRNIQLGEADRLEQFGAPPEKLDSVSPIVRERMVFPYTAGTALVGAIHRTGGFALVNEMYARPPRTTEQVLHPDKYVAGENPVEMAPPDPPRGLRMGAQGRMGELGILGLLEACVPRSAARSAASGWGGDAFTVVADANGRTSILWGTAWDSTEDAAEFTRAVRQCSDTRSPGQVHQEGPRVSVVAGDALRDPRSAHRYILGLRAWRAPPAPPLTVTQLAPVPALPEVPPATLSASRYDNPRLDLAMPVPPDFKASLVDGALVLEGKDGLLEVDFSPAVVTTESTARVYRDFIGSLGVHASRLEILSNDRIETPVGTALERTWAAHGTVLRLQVVVLPVCSRNGSVVFKRLWSDAHAGRLLDWVVQSTRRIRGGTPPVSAEL